MYACLTIAPDDLQNIRTQVQECGHAAKTFVIQWMDKDQTIYAEIERQVYIADKKFYEKKKGHTQTSKF